MPFADRAFVLIANRLIGPASEHGLAGWLETDFVCDRRGRDSCPTGTGTSGIGSTAGNSRLGTAPSISLWPPRRRSRQPEKMSAAAERLLQRNHGYRYYSWDIHQGGFRYFENAAGLEREMGIEGKSVIATGESGLSVLEVVAISKDLSDVERGFRQLKDVLAMRPIYHQIEQRVEVHILAVALALLVQWLLGRRLEEAGIDFSAERAMEREARHAW